MNKRVVIVGGGIAGYTLAFELAKGAFEISIVEKDLIGGTCLNRGCIPTKSLIYRSQQSKDFRSIASLTSEKVKILRESLFHQLHSARINIIEDEAVLRSSKEIFLKKSQATLSFDILVIATGSKPHVPQEFIGKEGLITSDDIFALTRVPRDLVIIGGGYIGLECATLFNALGSSVTVLEKEPTLLPNFEGEIVSAMRKKLEQRGIRILTGAKIVSIQENVISLDAEEILYDTLLVAAGRKINVLPSEIPLQYPAPEKDFKTSIDGIYVVGDVSGGPLLAHKAEYDARLLAQHLLDKSIRQTDYSLIPSCIFTNPQVAALGSFAECAETITVPFSALGRSYCTDTTDGLLKLALDASEKILGVQIVHKNACDLISVFIPLLSKNMTLQEAGELVFPHPSDAEIIKEAARGNFAYRKSKNSINSSRSI